MKICSLRQTRFEWLKGKRKVNELNNVPKSYILSASMSVQEKIPVKNIEERLASLTVVAASEQALHLCRVVG
jgi:hypothetical protein